MRHRGSLSYGWDEFAKAAVVNYTHHYFSIGATTSSWPAKFIGFMCSSNAAKRVSGEKLQPFRGVLVQVGLLFFKVYLYLYYDGDGRGGPK